MYWEYDSRIGRRWNQDPVLNVWASPYLCFDGNPILMSDHNGDVAGSAGEVEDPKKGAKQSQHLTGAQDGIAPNGNLILMGKKGKGVHIQSTNLGTDKKADFRVTYFFIEGENGGWSWNNEKRAFTRGGEEFSNGLPTAIFNAVGMGTGTNLSEAATNIINGEPFKDTRQAYSQYKQNGGGGAVPGFIYNGVTTSLGNWADDIQAGGNRGRDAWIGLWQFSSAAAKNSVFYGSPLMSKKLPTQIHHFATNKNKLFTPQMANIAKQFGLDLDGAWNKAALPHLGRHPNAYHIFVLKGMQEAAAGAGGSQKQFLNLFNQYVKQPVIQNPGLLRKSGW